MPTGFLPGKEADGLPGRDGAWLPLHSSRLRGVFPSSGLRRRAIKGFCRQGNRWAKVERKPGSVKRCQNAMTHLRRLTSAITRLRLFWGTRSYVVPISGRLELTLVYRKNDAFLRAILRPTEGQEPVRGDSGFRRLFIPDTPKQLSELEDLCRGRLLYAAFLGDKWTFDPERGIIRVSYETDRLSLTPDELEAVIHHVRRAQSDEENHGGVEHP